MESGEGMIDPHEIKDIASAYAEENSEFSVFLKSRAKPDELDRHFRDLHNEIFIRDAYDCCACANCCRRYTIRIEQDDILPIAELLGQSESDFVKSYLMQDPEESGVFSIKAIPCPFLDTEGRCRIYEARPLVCRDFPHTKKAGRLFHLSGIMGFAEDCPVVFEIFARLKKLYDFV